MFMLHVHILYAIDVWIGKHNMYVLSVYVCVVPHKCIWFSVHTYTLSFFMFKLHKLIYPLTYKSAHPPLTSSSCITCIWGGSYWAIAQPLEFINNLRISRTFWKKENNWSPAHPSAMGNLQSWLWKNIEPCMAPTPSNPPQARPPKHIHRYHTSFTVIFTSKIIFYFIISFYFIFIFNFMSHIIYCHSHLL